MMMEWGRETHGIRHYIAKVSMKNGPSIKLFEEKMGFVKVSARVSDCIVKRDRGVRGDTLLAHTQMISLI